MLFQRSERYCSLRRKLGATAIPQPEAGILSVEQVNNGLQFSGHGDRFDLRIMGCVIYINSTGARYQTGINYSIWTINPNGGWNVGINPHERIPSAGVTPIMFHISSGMTY